MFRAQTFVCKDAKPIDSLSMIWDGPNDVNVVSPTGDRVDGVVNGQEVSFNGLSGRGNDVFWVIDGAGLSGASRFHACPFSSGGPVFNGCGNPIGIIIAGFSAAMPVRKNIGM